MSFEYELSSLFAEHAIVEAHPLRAAGQTRLAKAISLLAAHPEASCILTVHRLRVVGIATRQDIIRALAQHPNGGQARLYQVVTRPVITVSTVEITEIASLLEQFERHQISHLPVVDEHQQLIGLIHQNRVWQALHTQGAEAQLRQQYQRAQLFAEITLKIRQSLQLKEILHTTVNEVRRLFQADRALIYQVLPDGTGQAISEAVVAPYPPVLGMAFPEEVFPKEYQTLYAQGRVQAIADVHAPDSGLAECLVAFINQWGIQSKLIVPILHPLKPALSAGSAPIRQHLWGLLIVHQCRSPRQWTEFEVDLMQQLADQISIALSQGRLLEYLEERVKLRTAELTQANVSLQQEIQERTLAEVALRQSEEQLRLITNNMPALIAYADRHQRYRFNNQVYEHWLGQSPKDIYGLAIEQVMGAAYYQTIRGHIETALAGEEVTYESELTFKDGRCRSMSVTYIPHVDVNGEGSPQVKGFFALTMDISDRKAIERMKDEFIAVVSHELRTPLTSIHTSLKLMATGRLGHLSEDGQQMLEVADENTDRLVRLVNNVLDLQRIESGEVTMDAYSCDAADLIEQAAEAMQTMAQQHEIEIHRQSVPTAIWADPDYIIQTLTNLMGNAIKFSEPGNAISLTVQSDFDSKDLDLKDLDPKDLDPKDSSMALFCVQDCGQGIPPDNLNSIFERFQQVDSSDSRKKGGTGLGLTICRKIIEQHGGKIWAESQLGTGSRFYFTVPRALTKVS